MKRQKKSFPDAAKYVSDLVSVAHEESLGKKMSQFFSHLKTIPAAKRIEVEIRLKRALQGQYDFAEKHGEHSIEQILVLSRLEYQIEKLAQVIESDKVRLKRTN